MSPMVERMARALFAHSEGPLRYYKDMPWDPDKEYWIEAALAALSALEEPTEGMVEAGIAQVNECTDNWSARAGCIPEHVFTAMIQAARGE